MRMFGREVKEKYTSRRMGLKYNPILALQLMNETNEVCIPYSFITIDASSRSSFIVYKDWVISFPATATELLETHGTTR